MRAGSRTSENGDGDNNTTDAAHDVAAVSDSGRDGQLVGRVGNSPAEPILKKEEDVTDSKDGDGHRVKRRKLDLEVRRSSSRAESPPWKSAAALGPTSFVEGGRRRSGRTNPLPTELQPTPGKRRTRAAVQQHTGNKKLPVSHLPPSSSVLKRNKGASTARVKSEQRHHHAASGTRSVTSRGSQIKTPPVRAQSDKTYSPVTQKKRQPLHASMRRSARVSEIHANNTNGRMDNGSSVLSASEDESEDELGRHEQHRPQRVRFTVRMPTLPVHSPLNVVQGRRYSSFQEWVEHDDPLEGETGYTTLEGATKEAQLRNRLLEESQPGGLLSAEKCSVFVPAAQEEPPRQYAHRDHLVAQVLHFQKLLMQEQRRHRAEAKRLAVAAVAEWKARQPKTEEEIHQEQRLAASLVYKQVTTDIKKQWDMVAGVVNERRLKAWEEEQKDLRKKALNQMMEQSTLLLDQRRRVSSESLSQEDSTGDEDTGSTDAEEDGSHSDDDIMSSDESESEGSFSDGRNSDEGLTVEELQQKYASIPESDEAAQTPSQAKAPSALATLLKDQDLDMDDLPEEDESNAKTPLEQSPDMNAMADVQLEEVDDALLDDSDESTDMESDMGSTDEESDDEGVSDNGSVDDNDDSSGLLGFFSKKEIQRVQQRADEAQEPEDNDDVTVTKFEDSTEIQHLPEPEDVRNGEDGSAPEQSQVLTPASNTASNIPVETVLSPMGVCNETPAKESSPRKPSTVKQLTPDPEESTAHASSQPSPGDTSVTKPSEVESVSSLEAQSIEKSSASTPQASHEIKTPIPFLLRGTLREYQHYGLDWLAGLYANHTNGILADEMGLGKTIQTIALLAHLACEHEVWGPHLVVVPTSVMLNWEMEFKKWCPGFKVLTYYGSQDVRKRLRQGWRDDNRWHVIITSYQLVLQDAAAFKVRDWHYLILDEAHNIKNFHSQRWQTLLRFKTRARLLLTGTPLQNNLTELWSLLYFLMPADGSGSGSGFADLQEFSEWFKSPVEQILEHGREVMDEEAKQIVAKLHQVLRPYLLRRLKADVEKQMPAKYEHVVYCRLSKRQRYLYDGFMARAQTRETLASGNYLSIINCLVQLRKVCNHPDLFETRQIVTSFAMPRSAIADYEIRELFVRKRLLRQEPMAALDLDTLNLKITGNENTALLRALETYRLNATRPLLDLLGRQSSRLIADDAYDASSIQSTLASLEKRARVSRLEELRHCVYINQLRTMRRPVYGSGLIKLLTIGVQEQPFPPKPIRRSGWSEWLSHSSPALRELVPSVAQRAQTMETTIQKFACVTPAVVAADLTPLTLTPKGVEIIRDAMPLCKEDPYHEARVRLSIAFPDKRLLQYDCGKLQRLDELLRRLQAGGHRALIFTQMTKVLDILEQFLNIHGHRYLRLDGATKVEQRQILTDRFNNDPRILAFILSSRSGGLGINLTGADTVIFYDLDWNPAMDKQCQDRCHRIGQTRDVHIYRFVSEYTIESNILRKANQKRMLDDVVIQEGEFTTDYFNKLSVRDMLGDDAALLGDDAKGQSAIDRELGAGGTVRALETVEDAEDRVASKVAEKEMEVTDEGDFDDKQSISANISTPVTPGEVSRAQTLPPSDQTNTPVPDEVEVSTTLEAAESGLVGRPSLDVNVKDVEDEEREVGDLDDYRLRFMEWELKDVPIVPPADKNKRSKKGKSSGGIRVRTQRPR